MNVKQMWCALLAVLALTLFACSSREQNAHADTEMNITAAETEMTPTAAEEPEEITPAVTTDRSTAGVSETEPPIPRETAESRTDPPTPQTEPPATQSAETKPVITAPIVTEPAAEETVPQTEPIHTEPVSAESAPREPIQTAPVQTESAITEPQTEAAGESSEQPSDTAVSSMFDQTVPSPDGTKLLGLEYAAAGHESPFMALLYRVHLVDAQSGDIIVTALTETEFPKVHWSPDSRYAAVSYGYNRYYTAAIVLDAVNGREIVLPHGEISGQIFGAVNNDDWGSGFYGFFTVPQSWHGDVIRVEMSGNMYADWREGTVGGIVGYYTFDLKTLSVLECVYLPFYNLTTLPPPDDDTEQYIYDRLLLIAGDGSCRDVQTLIAQNQAAYAELLAMAAETESGVGITARVYLEEVIYTNHGPYEPSQESLYAAKDIAAAVLAAIGDTGT